MGKVSTKQNSMPLGLVRVAIQLGAGARSCKSSAFQRSLQADLAALTSACQGASLDAQFVRILTDCNKAQGRVFTTWMGKSGNIAQRMAISLLSTGTPTQYVHAAEWMHGDIGAVRPGDAVVAF